MGNQLSKNSKNKTFTIAHLYPEEMNIYGDMGNILTLKRRLEWRNFEVKVINIGKGEINKEELKNQVDLYFMGGGQDDDMYAVFDDMVKYKKEFVESEVASNKVFLLICGGFELFGKYFLDATGRQMKGLDILPIETKAPGNALADRCLGNLVYDITDELFEEIKSVYKNDKLEKSAVGFENHSGQVFFTDEKIQQIGNVLIGKGNNAIEKKEGARIKNVFGSFTHGSLLPKNPHIADLLIVLALRNRFGEDYEIENLDDEVEWQAHRRAIDNLK